MSENLVGTMFVIGSFGASAVLVYGAPLAEFSQPRNLIGGSVLSALIGVAVYQVCGDYVVLASALGAGQRLSGIPVYRINVLDPHSASSGRRNGIDRCDWR